MTRERRAAKAAAGGPGVSVPGSGPGARFPARVPGVASPALTLDALGKKCPIPIIMLADRIREIRIGETIEVLADDPAAKTDLPAWCALKSQEFVGVSELPVGWSFLIRRSY